MKQTLIYRHLSDAADIAGESDKREYVFKLWKPSSKDFIPPNKNKKYFIYWLFHYLGFFKNKDYSSLLIFENSIIISSLLIVPTHFKWPFMSNNDLQFTYVTTKPAYRGQGLAGVAIQFAINKFSANNRAFWYVTDTDNKASQNLCMKYGFKFIGYGIKSGYFKVLNVSKS